VYNKQGQYARALEVYNEALQIVRAENIPRLEADLLYSIGRVTPNLGEHERALEILEQAAKLYMQLGNLFEAAHTGNATAAVHALREEWAAALAGFESGLRQFNELGATKDVRDTLVSIRNMVWKLMPDDEKPRVFAGKYTLIGDMARASLTDDPNDTDMLGALALALAGQGKMDEVAATITRLKRLFAPFREA
ncbi:MAG: tetratricopeptide repeat protein, partial [Anaerolineae bacterium]|nr:tetratricopeptide repeat protein [Anaerolineae bacterium]